jgi:hypothetical protein
VRYNPFRPNGIITTGMFYGRLEEAEAIEQSLHQTKNGNPKHFLLEGERGIGKSSLMFWASVAATQLERSDKGFNFLVVNIELGTTTTYLDLIRKIGIELRSQLRSNADIRTWGKSAWDFLSNWKVLGVEYTGRERELNIADAIDEIASTISIFLSEQMCSFEGVLILIDEADKPDSHQANLGEFVKLFTERLTKLRCDRVCIGLAGLPILLQKLKEGHESSLRIFETFNLKSLSDRESRVVIERGIIEANEKNELKTTIDDDALEKIVHLAEGYPHFIQQFGYSSFEQDDDYVITSEDVVSGAYKENGALDQLGRKYFSDMYFDKISSPDYRKVLDAMADSSDAWIQRKTITTKSGVKDTQITNALNALKSRRIILANPERPGEYRLPTRSFAVWIKAIGEKRDILTSAS